MILGFSLIITLALDLWLSWTLNGWTGIIIFMIFIPLTMVLMVGGGLALGLISLLFGRKTGKSRGRRFLIGFLKGWGWLVCIALLFPWLFFGIVNASNKLTPAIIPRVTITNGEKTVVFQSMMHIASPGFYQDVRQDMQNLIGQNYIFLYEGIKKGTPENMKKLSMLMGTNLAMDMYDDLAIMAGLTPQYDADFQGILPSLNADLSVDEIIAITEKQGITGADALPKDSIHDFMENYPTYNNTQKTIALVFSRGIMNLVLRVLINEKVSQAMSDNSPMFRVIIDERNKNLVKAITDSPSKNIYIHYGAMHYPGVFALLKKEDPRWEVVSKTGFSVIR